MRNKKILLRVKLLTFVSITIMVTVWFKYHWIVSQKSETCDKSYSVSESDTRMGNISIEKL
jgi:hypothetical protein